MCSEFRPLPPFTAQGRLWIVFFLSLLTFTNPIFYWGHKVTECENSHPKLFFLFIKDHLVASIFHQFNDSFKEIDFISFSVVTYVVLRTNLGQKEFITYSYTKCIEESEKIIPQNGKRPENGVLGIFFGNCENFLGRFCILSNRAIIYVIWLRIHDFLSKKT